MRFNKATISGDTTNLAGGRAYRQNSKLELVSILLTSFLQDTYYKSGTDTQNRIVELIKSVDPIFAAKAAIYARHTFGMRSVSHVVAGELCKSCSGKPWMKDFLEKVVKRPDDVLEISAYYAAGQTGKLKVTNQMRKGFGKALAEFDRYQLAKYKGAGKAFNLYDAVNLYRPKSNSQLKALMKGTLKPAETWNAKLSEAGKAETEEEKLSLKSDAWKKLLKEKKLGYLALIRNVRNIIDQGSTSAVARMIVALTNEDQIKKSLIFPFQIQTAIDEVLKVPGVPHQVIAALSDAMEISLSNVPQFDGRTLVVLDTSGSMTSGIGTKSAADIGSLFSAVMVKANNADFISFSDNASYMALNVRDSVIGISQWIRRNFKSAGTNFHSIFETACKPYDRIIILSDMQGWVGYNTPEAAFKKYCNKYKCKPLIYSFDLNAHGNMQFPQDGVYCVAGWSDKVFDIFKLLEQDRNALVNTIEEMVL